MSRPVTSVVGVREVPEAIRSLSTMNEPDYVDMFSMAAITDSAAEIWARAIYEDTLGAVDGSSSASFLASSSHEPRPGTVAGWRIAEHGEDWIRLEAGGGGLSASSWSAPWMGSCQ